MNKKWIILTLLTLLLASACSLLPGNADQGLPANAETQQAQIEAAVRGTATTGAMLTQIAALETQVSLPTAIAGETMAAPTLAPADTATPEPTATITATPTNTLVPATATMTPTATPVTPTATSTPSAACNVAKFEADVTVPDGTTFTPGTSFTKTWRLRNTGTCTWTTVYDLVFVSGNQMGGPSAVDLPGNVAPGQVIDVSVPLVAPAGAGSYRGNWKLRDNTGVLFGLGNQSVPFYVDIKVAAVTASIPLDMAAAYCSAEWTSNSNLLPCPGKDNDDAGFVLRIDKPTLESGYVDDEAALLTRPRLSTDSVIRGKYPAVRVESGNDFSAVIGCAYQASGCDVVFQLDYQIGSGDIKTLNSWREVYEGQYRTVNVDLSSLAGNDVKFILTVLANGSANADRALWLAPRINK